MARKKNSRGNKNIFITRLFFLSLTIALFAVVCYFAFFQKSTIIYLLDKYKLIPRPETFSELYFSDHLSLPKTINQNEPINYSFVIHNLEASDKNYPYKIYYISGDEYKLLNEGQELVKQNETKTIAGYYTLNDSQKKYAIYVELTELNQSIHFYINN